MAYLLELGGNLFSFIQLIELSFFLWHLIKNQLVVVLHEENRIRQTIKMCPLQINRGNTTQSLYIEK